jgi:ELP3 family radical SAM enzyme/protein acetyltransferase
MLSKSCNSGPDKIIDIEDVNKKLDKHIATSFKKPTPDEIIFFKPMIDGLLNNIPFNVLRKEFHYSHKKSFLFQIFLMLRNCYTELDYDKIRQILKIKDCKSHSGIISITVFTSPYPEYIDSQNNVVIQSFSCQWNCSYCPNEPGQPRSYLKGEPGVLRANRENFKCIEQMYIRLEALYVTGHDIDKLEVLVLGGTWTSYPVPYREQFIRDIYYAANTYKYNTDISEIYKNRQPLSLSEEKEFNKTATCKVIGLTLETRPDTITSSELKLFRSYGCTRIQLGIQHSDNEILNVNNRKCPIETTIKTIELLKNCGYKIDGHWMPNLPGSSIKKDDDMFENILGIKSKKYINLYHEVIELKCPELQVDQWKIYPTTITEFTDIKKWYEEGKYIPYSNKDLFDILIKIKKLVFPWIRLNRVIRDIPNDYVPQIDYHSNAREHLQKEIEKDGWYCACQRCREVKNGIYDPNNSETVIRNYNASNGNEYFISRESKDKKILYGFVRLRIVSELASASVSELASASVSDIDQQAISIFPELKDCSLIRELHVYGQVQFVGKIDFDKPHTQHTGIGKMLMNKAEDISKKANIHKIAVISGEGTRGYYEKLGYRDNNGEGYYMIKNL